MEPLEKTGVESDAISDFLRVMEAGAAAPSGLIQAGVRSAGRVDLDPDSAKNELGQLVLTLVKLLHELLERQAIRRIESGHLSDVEIERLGVTLMRQAREIERLREVFSLEEKDLNLDLGPLGKLL
jgi:hypothetical protein